MRYFFVIPVLALSPLNLYGLPSAGCGSGGPTAALTVAATTGTVTYTNFTMTGTANGCSIDGIFGTVATTGYTVSVHAFTMADPVIDFGMNFDGSPSDPNVSLMISTPYTGGPFPGVFAGSLGTLTDSDQNGSASVTPQSSGSDIQTVKINGAPLFSEGFVNPGCSFSGQPAGFSQPCPTPTSQPLFGNVPGTGTLELDVAFALSAGDSYSVNGSVNLVPEPGTNVLLAAGLVALIGLARRHSQ